MTVASPLASQPGPAPSATAVPPATAAAAVSSAADTTYERMLESVRYEGAYPTRERAEDAVHAVLGALGRRLTGSLRAELAACLPAPAALTLTAQIPAGEPLTGHGFVQELAARTGRNPGPARWDAGVVLSAVAGLAGPDLLDRILASLPPGYALLFGRAELIQSA